MNKLIISVIVLNVLLYPCLAQGSFFKIYGSYQGESMKEKRLQLCRVERGKTVKVATSSIESDGTFAFMYPTVRSGIYVLNVMSLASGRKDVQDHDLKRFYVEAGKNLEFEIELKEGEYTLVNTNSEKNELLSKWNTIADKMYSYSHGLFYNRDRDYVTFFSKIDEFRKDVSSFKEKRHTGDHTFDELLTLLVDTDLNYVCTFYSSSAKRKHPKREEYPLFYEDILQNAKPESSRLLELPMGLDYLRTYSTYALYKLPKEEFPQGEERKYFLIDQIGSPLLKGYYALSFLGKGKGNKKEEYKLYKAYLDENVVFDEFLVKQFQNYELSLVSLDQGNPGFNFKAEDVDGKIHQFSDYKGSVVYVDVWATWCGPCVKELPHLKRVEERYKDRDDIVFVSISVDKPENKEKWKEFVKSRELGGVQLIAGDALNSPFVKAYKISQIPRFMLFDKEGNIVSEDIYRPSNPKLIQLIETELKKK